MERFKIKNRIFLILAMIFVSAFFHADLVGAAKSDDYVVSAGGVEGLIYGEPYSRARIVGTQQSIPGTFKFVDPGEVIRQIGEINMYVEFVPMDSEQYMSILVPTKGVVQKRAVNVVFESPIYKQYDGTDTVDVPPYVFNGMLEDDDIRVTGELSVKYSGTYISEEVPLILTGIQLEGEDKNFYTLYLDDYFGRIHPASIKDISNSVSIGFDKDVFVDIKSSVSVQNKEKVYDVNNDYTSFLEYQFFVFDHHGIATDVGGKYNISLKIDESTFLKERLEVFEKTSDNKFTKLEYTYKGGMMYFEINSDSRIVFTTRNIEYHFILIFSEIIVFSAIFVIIYRVINSKIEDDEEER